MDSQGDDDMGWSDLRMRVGKQRNQLEGQTPTFEPAAVLHIELSEALPGTPTHPETGKTYRRAIVLARLHMRPLGVIELRADGEAITTDQLARGIWEALGPKIIAHLRDDGLPEVSELPPSGISCAGAPPCLAPRQSFLASAPFVSVVIPTHNRPEQVVALVESIRASDYPSAQYEIIVVDNAPSSTATAERIEQRYPNSSQVRYVREDRAGSAHARTCGLKQARGEIVVFADDDVLVDERWLTEMARGFDTSGDVVCVTGLIMPMESETIAQGWFEQFGGYCNEECSRRLFNLTDHRAESPFYPYNAGSFGAGASMAFRRSFLLSTGGFDPALGPATPALGGEDIDVMLRVILAGHSLLYEPGAIVRHPPYREYAQLRRQIQGYGVGLTACLCKNVVTNPRVLPDFIGKLPHGLLFAFGARSAHHARKQADYPKELTWLEIRGLLYGPLAYLRSRWRLGRIARRLALSAPSAPRAIPVGEVR